MRWIFFIFIPTICLNVEAQTLPIIHPPVVDTLQYTITDTVYVATNGDDSHPGTANLPVATFAQAMQLLPFGTPGINDGHAYGLIIIREGVYHDRINQTASQWRSGNTYKNISVQGEGEVIIGGVAELPLEGHAALLRGSHIFIKNIKLRYVTLIGLYIAGEATFPRTLSDVILEDVEVDSVGSHGVLINFAERVSANRLVVKHASGYEPPIPPYPCRSWPSGFKPYMSRHVSIRKSTVARNWGEGVNFHNCEYALAEDCVVSDNFAVNIYCDNSSKFIIRNNLIYNTPGNISHWRGCYGFEDAPVAPTGISIANERTCPTSLGFITNRGIPCALECINPFNGTFRIPTVDSLFIYNNIILNGGGAISFWEGETGGATSCMTNIWVVHNTCIGFESDPMIRNSSLIGFNFASGISLFLEPLSSIHSTTIAQNVFAYDSSKHTQIKILRRVLDQFFPAPFQVEFLRNVWSNPPTDFGFDEYAVVNTELPMQIPINEVFTWAEEVSASLLLEGDEFDFVQNDFLGRQRTRWYTGAIEPMVSSINSELSPEQFFKVYPNPTTDFVYFSRNIGTEKVIGPIEILDIRGNPIQYVQPTGDLKRIETGSWIPGIYLVRIQMRDGIQTIKLIKH